MIKVTVIYPSHGCAEDDKKRIEIPMQFDLAVSDALNAAWRLANFVDGSDKARFNQYAKVNGVAAIRSAMVGDVFIVDNNGEIENWAVDNIGFVKLTDEQLKKWESLDVGDRLMGVKGLGFARERAEN